MEKPSNYVYVFLGQTKERMMTGSDHFHGDLDDSIKNCIPILIDHHYFSGHGKKGNW